MLVSERQQTCARGYIDEGRRGAPTGRRRHEMPNGIEGYPAFGNANNDI